jgi:hypothetical protein
MLRKYPLAVVSCILGVLSFVHLFGLEKAILAVVLGGLALKEILPGFEKGRKYAYAGIVLGSLYIAVLLVVTIVKGPQIIQLIGKLR